MVELCRHCQRAKAYKPRQLCNTCYRRPGIRDLYPVIRPTARKGEPTAAELERIIAEQLAGATYE